jgi:hypothetical protein
MTRAEYLKLRDNPAELIYAVYEERFDSAIHKPFLTKQQLIQYIQMYTDINVLLKNLIQEYNSIHLNGETEIIKG